MVPDEPEKSLNLQRNRQKKMGKKMAGSRSMTLIFVIFSMLRPMGTSRREPTAPISVAEAAKKRR